MPKASYLSLSISTPRFNFFTFYQLQHLKESSPPNQTINTFPKNLLLLTQTLNLIYNLLPPIVLSFLQEVMNSNLRKSSINKVILIITMMRGKKEST